MAKQVTARQHQTTGTIGNIDTFIERMWSKSEDSGGALKTPGKGAGASAPSVRLQRLKRDAQALHDRAIKVGLPESEARKAAEEMIRRREKEFQEQTAAAGKSKLPTPGGNYAMPTPENLESVRAREWAAYQKRMGAKAGTRLPVPGGNYGMPQLGKSPAAPTPGGDYGMPRPPSIAVGYDPRFQRAWGVVPVAAPPASPKPETSPISAPIDVQEAYRWAQVLTRQEYREKFGTERDTSPTEAYTPATGEAIRILYGPHPCSHEGHLRRTGKPCGHWAMQLWLVGTPDGDHPGVTFRSGFRCFYRQFDESVYHDWLNAESTSYRLWDMHIHGQPYEQF